MTTNSTGYTYVPTFDMLPDVINIVVNIETLNTPLLPNSFPTSSELGKEFSQELFFFVVNNY